MAMYGPKNVVDVRFKPAKDDEDEGTIFIDFKDGKTAEFRGSFSEYLDFNNKIEETNFRP